MKKILIVTCILILGLLTGCLNNSQEASSEGDGGGSSQETYKWVAHSPWPEGTALQIMAEEIAKDITEASNGRLTVEMHASGEIVQPTELLDAVESGTVDAIHSWDGYWVGKVPQVALFASVPMGLNEQEYAGWITQGEGRELWQQAYDEAGYNLKILDAGAGTPEIFYHSNVPIRALEDFKGLKVRAVGDWGAILDRVGASVVSVNGSELYQSLERGVVDAVEYSGPASNLPLGFHEVAEYLITPSLHQPGSVSSFIINQKKWDELPGDLKEIVRLATENMWGKGFSLLAKEDMQAMSEYRKLEEEGQIEIIRFEEESQKELKQIIDQYYEERSEEDPLFKKIWESQQSFAEKYNYWKDAMTPDY
ncbi:TRAP transporter substrate-binding protein [Oceanobacillus salinisoli]|uniref:TRAP transporter substrate-binding protein n=1 Tax=Oceanobacillus salinisoli TaxID=2678611 RepID=UPI0018CBFCB3|nr:TRAP transporter substrate-binding protein DctP [Oceanobacillus salinisoli]